MVMKRRRRRTVALAALAALMALLVALYLYWHTLPVGPPIESASATLLPKGHVLVAGGDYGRTFPDNNPSTSALAVVYDPKQRVWRRTASMPTPRENQVAIPLRSGRVLVAGGIPAYGANAPLRSAVLYDARGGHWTVTGSMHVGRQVRPDVGIAFRGVALSDGRVLVIGGVAGPLPQAGTTELYAPATHRWSLTAGIRCGAARRFEVPALLPLASGKVLALCDNYANQIVPLVFDPARRRWYAGQGVALALHGYTATLLSSGTILVTGGSTDQYGNEPSNRTWLYDPKHDRWSPTGPLHLPLINASAIRLEDGRVLMVGGFQRQVGKGGGVTVSVSTSCELYDPRSGRWTATGSLPAGAGYATLVRLLDGSVLALSGTLPSAQRYDPASQRWTAAQ
jgi:trimeric autotransporter adhesin